ncbi:MAG: glycine cleavage system aminomethyltransferase GcvT [Bdellovibrionales bacterium]
MAEIRSTPLVEEHIALGARMVEFAGWNMPIQYKGLKEEHACVRNQVGLFDVSHMGEVFFRGDKSLESLQWMTSNDVSKLKAGDAQYSVIPNKTGGIVDDIIIYCLEENREYMVCVNAANTAKDVSWFQENNKGADISDESSSWGQIAIQGKNSVALMQSVFGKEIAETAYFKFKMDDYQGAKAIIARTGYTGEDGFEVFIQESGVVALWKELMDKGQSLGVQAIGLGARDTLRTEMKYSLYGHEITDDTNPYEASLGWTVKPDKGDFLGKEEIINAKNKGLNRKLIGLEMLDRGIPRDNYELENADGQKIGFITSGTQSPSLAKAIGIAYVSTEYSDIDTEIFVNIRGRKSKAKVVKTPFVNPKGA